MYISKFFCYNFGLENNLTNFMYYSTDLNLRHDDTIIHNAVYLKAYL